jgi:hypothetical protein
MKDTVVMILGALVFAAAGARASTTYFPAMLRSRRNITTTF